MYDKIIIEHQYDSKGVEILSIGQQVDGDFRLIKHFFGNNANITFAQMVGCKTVATGIFSLQTDSQRPIMAVAILYLEGDRFKLVNVEFGDYARDIYSRLT